MKAIAWRRFAAVFVPLSAAGAGLSLLAAHASPTDDLPVDDVPRPGGTGEIRRILEEDLQAQREMWRRIEEERQRWFDRKAIGGNAIEIYATGVETYKARMDLIQKARRTIFLSAFAFKPDNVGMNIAYQLCLKAQQGVQVRLLLDTWASKPFRDTAPALRDCGAKVFFSDSAQAGIGDLPYAIHEKLLIVDGEHVITGGSGYANHYYLASRTSKEWHDLDAKVSGPSACWFHRKYAENWKRSVRAAMAARTDFTSSPSPEFQDFYWGSEELLPCAAVKHGELRVLPTYNNPLYSEERPNLEAHLSAILASKKTIRLYAPYFVPDKKFLKALTWARENGVEVTIITNSPWSTDEKKQTVLIGMYWRVRKLLKAGASIRLWNPKSTMHRKGGIYDGRWAFFGSDNLDNRGQHYSSESLAFTDDAAVVSRMEKEYGLDLELTIPLTREFLLKELEGASWFERKLTSLIIDYL